MEEEIARRTVVCDWFLFVLKTEEECGAGAGGGWKEGGKEGRKEGERVTEGGRAMYPGWCSSSRDHFEVDAEYFFFPVAESFRLYR